MIFEGFDNQLTVHHNPPKPLLPGYILFIDCSYKNDGQQSFRKDTLRNFPRLGATEHSDAIDG